MTFWKAEIGSDGVGVLALDVPGEKHNVLRTPVMEELDRVLDDVPRLKMKGLVIASAKPDSFIAGADIKEIEAVLERGDARDGAAKARMGQAILRRLEDLPIPTVAAIVGPCLGGGCELALACRYRVAADHPKTRIGLPETRLGIVPGFGGTQRLPRLVGLARALEMIPAGKAIDARRAASWGLVDRVVAPGLLLDEARRLAREAPPLPERRGRPTLRDRLVESNALGVALACRVARIEAAKRTKGRYPAVEAAIDLIEETWGLAGREARDRGYEREAEVFGRMAATDVARNLVRVFFLTEGAKKRKAADAAPRPVRRAAVVGAGVMGGGIAWAFADAGLPVVVKDVAEAALGTALRRAERNFAGAVKRRKRSAREAERRLALIRPTLEYDGFAMADVVVEAVVERLDVKKAVLAEVEAVVRPDCVLATNTSALPIGEMAKALRRPERLAGLHFFNPVHRMPLVEVVRPAGAADECVATLAHLARSLGKTPILVADSPGFLVNRLLLPYVVEAARLLEEGAVLEEVDAVAEEFGMPMGPAALADEVGIDVGAHVAAHLGRCFPDRMPVPPLLEGVHAAGLRGKKTGAGFYLHEGERRRPNPSLDAILEGARRARGIEPRPVGRDEIRERLFYPMVAEAARCLEEGVVALPEDVDVGMIYGAGWPPFRGGLLRWADAEGVATIVGRLEALAQTRGGRFDPGTPLRQVAAHGGFYR